MKAFSEVIASGSLAELTFLDLSLNQIGSEGMKAFSTAIASGLANLNSLVLDINQIGDEGMKAFSEAISSGSLANLAALAITNPSDELEAHCSSEGISLIL